MTHAFHLRGICTVAGHRELAGTAACSHPCWLIINRVAVHCGHCLQPIHQWVDGSLLGLVLTCDAGALTIRLADFDVDLHRCGEPDALDAAIDDVITQITTRQEVPAQ